MDSTTIQRFQYGQLTWDDLQSLLLVDIDQLYQVKTRHSPQPEAFKNGTYHPIPMMVRYTDQATPLADRQTDCHPGFRMANLMLRCLNIARHIEQSLKYYQIADEQNTPKKLFCDLLSKILAAQNHECTAETTKTLECEFNRECLELLKDHGLENNELEHHHEVLLQHRYLASTLAPAIGQQTFLVDPTHQVTIEEICYPITEKTDQQFKAISQENHPKLPYGIRKAKEVAFDNVRKGDRRLPAQCRLTYENTVKNGWIVFNRLHFPSGKTEEFSYIRCASLVPLVKGLSNKNQIQATADNIEQLKLNAKNFGLSESLHITILNTQDSAIGVLYKPQKEQNDIVKMTSIAASQQNARYSYFPINDIGTLKHPEIDPYIQSEKAWKSLNIFEKDVRALNAAKLNVAVSNMNLTPVFVCASGQDRSSVVSETYSQLKTMEAYQRNGMIVSREHIEHCRAMGFPTATLSTLAAPGSFGLKNESKPADLFSESTNNMLFTKTSNTNKKAPIARKVAKPQKTDLEEFEQAKLTLQQFIDRNPKNIFVSFVRDMIEPIKITDYKAIEALKLVYLIASDPIKHVKKIELLSTIANSMYQKQIKNKRVLAIIFAVFAIILLATAITVLTNPVAGLIAQQSFWNSLSLTVAPHHIQYAGGIIGGFGLKSCCISGVLFFNTRLKGAPKEMLSLAKTAMAAQSLKSFDTTLPNSSDYSKIEFSFK